MNKIILKRLGYSATCTIILTLIYSINTNLIISLMGGIIMGVALFVTDYLYSFNKKYLNVLLVIIASTSLSIANQVVYKKTTLFQIICYFTITLVIYKISRYKRIVNN